MKNFFDICYVIAHGFAARMLLQTGLILQLTEHGKRIAIIAPDAQDANLKMIAEHPQITLFEASAKNNIWDDDYLFKRKYFLENIKANPALWEKHIQAIRYNTSKHPWRRIRPFLYYLVYVFNQYFPSIGKRFAAKENQYLESKDMADLIKKINPKLVISTYPVSLLEAKVLYAAKQQNISTTIHLLSWDNISCKGKFPILADNFITWGNIMSDELREYYGISDDRIYPCGVPHFDHHIKVKQQPKTQELLTNLGLRSDLPYIFVAMSSPYFAPREIDIVEWLAKAISEDVFGKKMQLVVRPHPQNVSGFLADKSWLGRLKNIQNKRVAVDFPQLVKSKMRWSMQQNDMNHLSNLLIGSSVVLNSGSTVAIDALMVEKPVIFTSFDGDAKLSYWKSARRLIDYNHLAKFIKIGGGTPVFSYEELKEKIQEYVANPKADLAERNHALVEQCFKNDGQSTGRVVEAVLEILQEKHHPEKIKNKFKESWKEIEDFYIKIGKEFTVKVLQLIAEMKKRGFDEKLRAGQSLYCFIVSRSKNHGLRGDQERVRMSFPFNGENWMKVSTEKDGIVFEGKIEYSRKLDLLLNQLVNEEIS